MHGATRPGKGGAPGSDVCAWQGARGFGTLPHPMQPRPLSVFVCALVACSARPTSSQTLPQTARATQTTATTATPAATSRCPGGGASGMRIEGQLGTLPQTEVNRVMRAATPRFGACFTTRAEALPYLAGHVLLRIRVGEDGAVRWAIPTESTLGDREAERCMAEHARALRFDPPCGGEAEVRYPIDLDASEDARPATAWPATRVARVVTQHRAALDQCRRGVSGRFAVTVYVTPEGRVAAAGTSVPSETAEAAAECVVREVATWRLPSPGSWYARTTFQVE